MDRDGGGIAVRFWGTRGSLPSPGAQTVRYGGNTSCVEIRAGGQLLIFDAGSGLRELGNTLVPQMPITAHLFLSHYHWDHIMGLPFFGPLFVPGNVLHLYGETKGGQDVGRILSGQMVSPYFPVTMDTEARATLEPHPLAPGGSVRLGDVTVSAGRLHHPDDALAYRVDHAGRSVVYATDIEHHPASDPALVEFASGADALIFDATYTDAEYAGHVGWGHSTWRAGVEIAGRAGVGQLIIFHHLPERTDAEVAAIERAARRTFSGAIAAREGMELHYPPAAVATTRPPKKNGSSKKSGGTKKAAGASAKKSGTPKPTRRRNKRATPRSAGRRLDKPAKGE